MKKIDQFKQKLVDFDGENIPDKVVDVIQKCVDDPDFTIEFFTAKSAAAANLATWVINIFGFNRIFVKVKPLMESLHKAQEEKRVALEALAAVQEKVAGIQKQLQELEDTFKKATAEKKEVEDQAAAGRVRLGLADRLIGGLSW